MKAMYFIALVVPDPEQSILESIRREISRKYKTYAALKSPPHITMIAPFHWEEKKENELTAIIKNYHPPIQEIQIEISGFGCFEPRVIFANPLESPELSTLESHITEYMKTNSVLKRETHRPFHPHITLANRDWSEYDFYKAWEEFNSRNLELRFAIHHISLLKLEKTKWITVAEFPLSAEPKPNGLV